MDERQKWLDSLQEGDLIAVDYSHGPDRWEPARVGKVTPTRRFTITFYNRPDHVLKFDSRGMKMGRTRWDNSTIMIPVTQEMRDERKRRSLIHKIQKLKLDDMTLAQAVATFDLLQPFNLPEDNR